MKTSLDHLPAPTRERLLDLAERVRRELPSTEAVILFGSYARGDYVVDGQWRDYHPEPSRYHSDYDIAVLTSPHADGQAPEGPLRHVANCFKQKYGPDIPVQFHRFSVTKFNRMVKQHRYFFLDIVNEGILLYDAGRYPLGEKRNAPWYPLILKWARHDWKRKRRDAEYFFESAELSRRNRNYRIGDFMLHQVCESWYQAINLVMTEYRPKTHDLSKLRNMTLQYAPEELNAAFPLAKRVERRRFNVLWDGYIRGRYDRLFTVSKADYVWLAAGAERLGKAARRICLARIREVARLAKEQEENESPPDWAEFAPPGRREEN